MKKIASGVVCYHVAWIVCDLHGIPCWSYLVTLGRDAGKEMVQRKIRGAVDNIYHDYKE